MFALIENRFNLFYKNIKGDNTHKLYKLIDDFSLIIKVFKFLDEIFTQHLKKFTILPSYFHLNLKNKVINLKVGKNRKRSLHFSINSSIHIIKKEILKLNEIEQQLGYFELSITYIGILQHKLKKKIMDLQKIKKNEFNLNSILFEIIFLFIIITFLCYCGFFFI